MDIQYIGEHLLPGQFGQLANVLGFVASLLAAVAYFFATQRRETTEFESWRRLGRAAFLTHGMSVFAVIGTIFYMMINQYYEYQYVQAHVSDDLPMQYIFSAFWEGQEGSFLLWMFWHVILGFVLMFGAKRWEAPTLAVLALVQVFLGSMILGVHLTDTFKIGSSPLLLFRDVIDAPIFNNADYLTLIEGNGLNPLLQNYWMTIHPPVLFLGFASTVVPFCYAIAGLWTKEHKAWLKPGLTWALFSGGMLGTGILMGGAWAYEALSFGGYWAWDPVENASLVPWLLLVAGVHTNLVARSTGHSIGTSYIFYILTFFFILYSTFLTRSGVLGETSVHAFTEMGLEWQLIAFMSCFLFIGFGLFAQRYKSIPSHEREEATDSREFWMFIGSLVLLFSALLITGSTSLPVYNDIRQFFDPGFEGLVISEPIPHYNKYQLWIAVFIGLLSGTVQFLRYREPNFKRQVRKLAIHLGASALITGALTFLAGQWINLTSWQYSLLLFTGIFTVVANLDYLIFFLRHNLKAAASTLSHIGFGLMIVGILASGLNKQFISSNPFAMRGLLSGATEDQLRKNIMLIKDRPMYMSGYDVTYLSDTLDGFTRTFDINFKQRDDAGTVIEEFTVYPNVLYNKEFTKIASVNPSTRHYWSKDIFSHISSLPPEEMDIEIAKASEDSLRYNPYEALVGKDFTIYDTIRVRDVDTMVIRAYTARVEGIQQNPVHPDYAPEEGDLTIGARVAIEIGDSTHYADPMLALRGQLLFTYPSLVNDITSKVRLKEELFERFYPREENLEYETFTFKVNESIAFKDWNITFKGFNRAPEHPAYTAEEGDIAVSAMVEINTGTANSSFMAAPVYLIRNNRPFNLKDEISEIGAHFRFNSIDPKTESVELMIAKETLIDYESRLVPLEVATNAPPSNYVVLQAIVFPGINFFWLGSCMMLFGLFFGMWNRYGKS